MYVEVDVNSLSANVKLSLDFSGVSSSLDRK